MIELTWGQVTNRAKVIAGSINLDHRFRNPGIYRIYPVPNGGIFAALLVQQFLPNSHITENPFEANIVIDDLIDSGETRSRFPGYPFYALYNKKREGIINEWISFPWERMSSDNNAVEDNITRILQYIGEDPTREGLLDTPKRVVKSYEELFSGYKESPAELLTTFEDDGYDEIVMLKSVEFASCCEHHMLPFIGEAAIAYIPNGRVVGISKLVRVFEIFCRRLQIQERLCQQVTQALDEYLKPRGSACVIQASHNCMVCRGVKKQHSIMVTSSLTGVFKKDQAARQELMNLIKG